MAERTLLATTVVDLISVLYSSPQAQHGGREKVALHQIRVHKRP
jgi:hypothetical protein